MVSGQRDRRASSTSSKVSANRGASGSHSSCTESRDGRRRPKVEQVLVGPMRTTVAVVNAPGEPLRLRGGGGRRPARRRGAGPHRLATGLYPHRHLAARHHDTAEVPAEVFGHERLRRRRGDRRQTSRASLSVDHVVLSLASCRTCARCKAGLAGYCEQTMMLNYMGFRMDGSTSYTPRGRAGLRPLLRSVSPSPRHAVPPGEQRRRGRQGARPHASTRRTAAASWPAPAPVLNVLKPGSEDSVVVLRRARRSG